MPRRRMARSWPLLVLLTVLMAPVAAGAILASDPDASARARFERDLLANGLAVIVLIGLVISLVAVPVLAVRGMAPEAPHWLVPGLVLLGLGVSTYLATLAAGDAEAFCGPIGDCAAVHQSPYARLAGLPLGALGVIAYSLMLATWAGSHLLRGRVAIASTAVLLLLAFGGTLFSAYLTFLEPFVIGATCLWCLTSALTVAALLWATARPGWSAMTRSRHGRRLA